MYVYELPVITIGLNFDYFTCFRTGVLCSHVILTRTCFDTSNISEICYLNAVPNVRRHMCPRNSPPQTIFFKRNAVQIVNNKTVNYMEKQL